MTEGMFFGSGFTQVLEKSIEAFDSMTRRHHYYSIVYNIQPAWEINCTASIDDRETRGRSTLLPKQCATRPPNWGKNIINAKQSEPPRQLYLGRSLIWYYCGTQNPSTAAQPQLQASFTVTWIGLNPSQRMVDGQIASIRTLAIILTPILVATLLLRPPTLI